MTCAAALDLGSNSFHLLVGELAASRRGARLKRARTRKIGVRLAEPVATDGRLGKAGRARAHAAVDELLDVAAEAGARQVVAVATEAIRSGRGRRATLRRARRAPRAGGARPRRAGGGGAVGPWRHRRVGATRRAGDPRPRHGRRLAGGRSRWTRRAARRGLAAARRRTADDPRLRRPSLAGRARRPARRGPGAAGRRRRAGERGDRRRRAARRRHRRDHPRPRPGRGWRSPPGWSQIASAGWWSPVRSWSWGTPDCAP